MLKNFYDADHEAYRDSVRQFLRRVVAPNYEQWENGKLVDRTAWKDAGANGMLGLAIAGEHGGGDVEDYRFRMVFAEEAAAEGYTSFAAGLSVHDDVVAPYLIDLATDEQKARWLPGMAAGTTIGAIAMTEPGTGSDLQGIQTSAVSDDAGGWVINGQKTFITNGIHADLVIVVVRTDKNPSAGSRAFTLMVVERDAPGFSRGRKLNKVGLAAQDTAELSFEDVHVASSNVLGEVGMGMIYLMQRLPRERVSIAVSALTSCEAALRWTLDYAHERTAFGKRIGDFQATRFALAEMETEVEVTRAYIEKAVLSLNDGALTAVEASKAKWWASELQQRVTTRCLQVFGGYGYMREYPIARAYQDARVQTIYGGTTEIMKELIGRDQASRYRT
ncbi:MAG: acdA 7 [Aeromicrobium sp.]|jgi:alkylation response protein AidB-like acyl-CoA dehydrogenase|nr:acdA 7 [Aeromicrobium sp.]